MTMPDDAAPPPADDFDPMAIADSIRRHGAPADIDAALATIYAED
ncbi:hypothetical protein Rhe02_38890 [Rhizocola hellebori]|uniref:Uncharacterized protein n=1 Tax=Rhizocola hellebori TaxID=1392758 RepID=A0A8J3Q9I5_9ACTN|nr:hypothetical protein [Rhizocola hellebori]GIH05822.1 hypothetical protein Rhe02_38890 [Rhizocola hellebori]